MGGFVEGLRLRARANVRKKIALTLSQRATGISVALRIVLPSQG